MRDFFDKYLNLKKILEGKRDYRQQVARVNALPEDYRYVFQKIQEYMWRFVTGDGYDMAALQESLLARFEEGAAAGRPVLDLTGEDVAGFADEQLKSVKTCTQSWREKLNRDVARKLNGGNQAD